MSIERLHYLDFELRISRGAGQQYEAHVYNSPGGQATGSFTIPLSQDRLELLILRLTRIRSTARRVDTPELAAARELGGVLFNAVFQGGIRDVFRSSLEKYRQQPDTGLRLKLRLQDVPELADLPWEFLYDHDLRRFLAQSTYTPVVRYIELPESIPPLRAALPLHILGLVAAPSDYPPLDVKREQSLVMEALQPLIESGQVKVTWVEKATLKTLRRCVQGGKYHVFHFIGHGGFDHQTEQGVLLFEDEHGLSARVDAERLGVLLRDHRTMRLAVLNACEGARNTTSDPFAGVATTLAQQGLAAVIAMQFSISDAVAIAFSSELYAALALNFPVDGAVAEARKAIFTELSPVEWGTPVLYIRAEDGVLFKLVEKPQGLPAEEKPAPQIHINTGGGAYIAGNVNTGGGDFVGQNQNQSQQPETRKGSETQVEPGSVSILHPHSSHNGSKQAEPAFLHELFYLPDEPLLGFVEIPVGPFLMGSDPKKDKRAEDNEQPQHTVNLPRFWMARYTVTVAQYRAFVEDSGYKTTNLDSLRGVDNHPVVWITWHAALAYCQWLTGKLRASPETPELLQSVLRKGGQATLPSEAEWEKAARGTYGWIYPWGDSFDSKKANTGEGGIGGTSAVRCYAGGASPYGMEDMSGNVWEWTRSLWGKDPSNPKWGYPYRPGDERRENLKAGNDILRVLRGGSWIGSGKHARCAFRHWYVPSVGNSITGFRVVILLS